MTGFTFFENGLETLLKRLVDYYTSDRLKEEINLELNKTYFFKQKNSNDSAPLLYIEFKKLKSIYFEVNVACESGKDITDYYMRFEVESGFTGDLSSVKDTECCIKPVLTPRGTMDWNLCGIDWVRLTDDELKKK